MKEANIVIMLELLGSKRIRKTGGNILASCPLGGHKDRNPSFSIRPNANGPSPWQCFSCGEKGNKTISLLYKIQENGGGWRDDIHQIIKNDEQESPLYKVSKFTDYATQKRLKNERISRRDFYQDKSGYTIKDYEGKFDESVYKHFMSQVPPYILNRGISMETCARWKLGYMNIQYPHRLFIPIYSFDDRMVGYSGRLISKDDENRGYPKYKHAKYFTKDKYLYGEHLINHDQKTCFIMESFFDVWNLDQIGLKNCLAIMGTSMSATQVNKISQWFEKAIILPHDDKPHPKTGIRPGLKMANDCKYGLEQAGVKVMISPIVPHKRQIGDEYRSPQDPGEWTVNDVNWVFEIIRRSVSESERTIKERENKKEAGREKETTNVYVAEEINS